MSTTKRARRHARPTTGLKAKDGSDIDMIEVLLCSAAGWSDAENATIEARLELDGNLGMLAIWRKERADWKAGKAIPGWPAKQREKAVSKEREIR